MEMQCISVPWRLMLMFIIIAMNVLDSTANKVTYKLQDVRKKPERASEAVLIDDPESCAKECENTSDCMAFAIKSCASDSSCQDGKSLNCVVSNETEPMSSEEEEDKEWCLYVKKIQKKKNFINYWNTVFSEVNGMSEGSIDPAEPWKMECNLEDHDGVGAVIGLWDNNYFGDMNALKCGHYWIKILDISSSSRLDVKTEEADLKTRRCPKNSVITALYDDNYYIENLDYIKCTPLVSPYKLNYADCIVTDLTTKSSGSYAPYEQWEVQCQQEPIAYFAVGLTWDGGSYYNFFTCCALDGPPDNGVLLSHRNSVLDTNGLNEGSKEPNEAWKLECNKDSTEDGVVTGLWDNDNFADVNSIKCTHFEKGLLDLDASTVLEIQTDDDEGKQCPENSVITALWDDTYYIENVDYVKCTPLTSKYAINYDDCMHFQMTRTDFNKGPYGENDRWFVQCTVDIATYLPVKLHLKAGTSQLLKFKCCALTQLD